MKTSLTFTFDPFLVFKANHGFCPVFIAIEILRAVPRLPDFALNIPHIVEVVEQEKPKCIFLTSPNNPDGRYVNFLTYRLPYVKGY